MFHQPLRWIVDETFLLSILQAFPSVALVLILAACILALSKGADWMIDGVVVLASRTKLPRIVIGATIVSLGTTMPEVFVSVMAAWMGNPGLALGNGVGSIIADTGLIFGLICLLTVVPMNRFILDRTGWVQVGAATLLVLISFAALASTTGEPVLSRGVGALFLLLLAGYLYLAYKWAKQGASRLVEVGLGDVPQQMGLFTCWLMIVGGLLLVIVSARVLVPVAHELAQRLGVPEDVIAATMVAFGTSLPELITAIASVRKGHPEIMVGNVVGADVLNCLFVIGAAAAARPLSIPFNFYVYHFPIMLLILYLFRYFIYTNRDGYFKRWQGGCLLGIYTLYLVLQFGFKASP